MIITNHNESHKENLLTLFNEADEIIFASGFLKNSGLNNIKDVLKDFCKDKRKKSTFYIGIGFGETDPKTLESLNNIIKSKANHQLILCTPDAGIFHSKIYVFRKNRNITIVIGSANLTEAGWLTNDEVSTISETTIDSLDYKQLLKYFSRLHKSYYTDDISELILKYKFQLEQFKDKYSQKPTFRFRRKKSTIAGIDMLRLKNYYENYLESTEFVEPSEREEQYTQAQENLDILGSNINLNDTEFRNLFGPLMGHSGFRKLWHSGSIHRGTHKTLNHYANNFRVLVREIKNNINQPIEKAFSDSMTFLNNMRRNNEMSGIGENIIAEILMTYNSEKFANLNKNPVTVLSIIGKELKTPSAFNGIDYKEYTTLLFQIRQELNMKSFLEIDSFFNYVYWNLKEE
ncbi:restriction endonuclease PLD domain-containing protein [Flavobacterium caseinilyticum]|uniref:NgoFVII family restriction endonuclease n=1 Tax=Flavobacterium caseinilyticum TaxID=2541732 RepID=A0A4R5AV09_9FLAO|nr:restriction endonuclease PLD domain-containing protein [Flavobacterium caseinilyticum]TDD77198.1 NgoFVII family restriction endonuclease [Flavobacterium caseinilyticum]